MNTDPRDFYKALEGLDGLDLPFTLAEAGQEDDHVAVRVASNEVEQVVAYFEEHPFTLANGTTMPVKVTGLAGGWISEPAESWAGEPDPVAMDQLLGSDVREGARRANENGWIVRAYEPGAPLTADNRANRLNLCYSNEDIVTDAYVG